jgi:hypothetical protein
MAPRRVDYASDNSGLARRAVSPQRLMVRDPIAQLV